MTTNPSIRILTNDSNQRGDLFGRLMGDLFVSLGYDNIRLNIARSGREIDIEAEHRFERRRAIAECKAWEEKVGGKEINAFAGKLRPERHRNPRAAVTPYFISLSGFTEPSLDQEKESGSDAVILLTGSMVVSELIKGRIIVPLERATERAGQCVASVDGLVLAEEVELLAHESGWIWAVYYTQGRQRTHFVLVHADGTPLTASIAQTVIEADSKVDGHLHKLVCLNPEPVTNSFTNSQAQAALQRYYDYLNTECGYILLDGLPADAEVGSLRLRLENLFVPLKLTKAEFSDYPFEVTDDRLRRQRRLRTMAVGELLTTETRIAVLASPGGGKSTLLKRLAVAYADPARRTLSHDQLPNRPWLPIFIRCRELREKARAPVPNLLDALAVRAFLGEYVTSFRIQIDLALRDGNALLLVDGLDEITDSGDRAAFVRNLRTCLGMYPMVSLVVTSREAGFRDVAGLLATICFPTRIADFDNDDVRRLTVAWHREVIANRPDVINDAEQLATTIVNNNRIKQLAVNPLLLTTLLLVKRWVGQLPTRRSVLYGKAVEVLLMTWNVEGHAPIEQDEALPQLCYIAAAMMRRGSQKISRPDLTRLLMEAREQLAAELAFARIGVSELIERVEHRSSLLMMSGHEVVDGSLTEFYEFRHLTFQEYLTAKAFVEGWYADRSDGDTLVSLLDPYLGDSKWREVIPLAAVLAGRRAEQLVIRLTDQASRSHKMVYTTLGNCLADEVQATPETVRAALQALLARWGALNSATFTRFLALGKYGGLLKEEIERAFVDQPTNWIGWADLLGKIVATQIFALSSNIQDINLEQSVCLEKVEELLSGTESIQRCEGALAARYISKIFFDPNLVKRLTDLLTSLITGQQPAEHLAGCMSFARVLRLPGALDGDKGNEILERLFALWNQSDLTEVQDAALLAFNSFPVVSREAKQLEISKADQSFEDKTINVMKYGGDVRTAIFVAAYYLRFPFNDAELRTLIDIHLASPNPPWGRRLRQLRTLVS